MCLALTGCGTKITIKEKAELNEVKGVSMTIKKDTLTRKGATIVITDLSGNDNTYGEEYRIDKKENGSWQVLEVVVDGNYAFTSIGYYVNKNKKLQLDMDWEWLYGSLKDGEYRIVKSVTDNGEEKFFSVEFTIS